MLLNMLMIIPIPEKRKDYKNPQQTEVIMNRDFYNSDLGHVHRSLVPNRKEVRRPMSGCLISRSAVDHEVLLVCEASVRKKEQETGGITIRIFSITEMYNHFDV